MPLYCGIDLHAKSSYLAIIDEQRKRIFKRNVPNDRATVLGFLAPYKSELAGVVGSLRLGSHPGGVGDPYEETLRA